jgi:hypothetical protein
MEVNIVCIRRLTQQSHLVSCLVRRIKEQHMSHRVRTIVSNNNIDSMNLLNFRFRTFSILLNDSCRFVSFSLNITRARHALRLISLSLALHLHLNYSSMCRISGAMKNSFRLTTEIIRPFISTHLSRQDLLLRVYSLE